MCMPGPGTVLRGHQGRAACETRLESELNSPVVFVVTLATSVFHRIESLAGVCMAWSTGKNFVNHNSDLGASSHDTVNIHGTVHCPQEHARASGPARAPVAASNYDTGGCW